MLRNPLSLRARTTSWYAGLLAVSLAVSSLGVYFGIKTYLKRQLQRELQSTAQTISDDFLTKLPVKGQAWVIGEVRESYEGIADDQYVRLSSGNTVLYQTADMRDPAVRLSEINFPRQNTAGLFHRQMTSGGYVMIYSLPYRTTDGRLMEVEAGISLQQMERSLAWLARIVLIADFLTLIGAILGRLPFDGTCVAAARRRH